MTKMRGEIGDEFRKIVWWEGEYMNDGAKVRRQDRVALWREYGWRPHILASAYVKIIDFDYIEQCIQTAKKERQPSITELSKGGAI